MYVRAALLGAAAAALLLPSVALADSRGEAKRHFRDGMSMIAAGQVERGIAELKQAYAIKPHPDVLYDIAKAYVDLGNIPEALSYFRQYAATDPEDRAQVERVMARLQAAIAPGPGQPAGAAASGGAPSSGSQTDTQRLIAQLTALINQQSQLPVSAREPSAGATATPVAPGESDMFEATPITAQTKATTAEIARELSGVRDLGDDLFEEQFVTAGVRSSSEQKAPASLTVISGEEIHLSGASTIPELLRRVPGVDVAEMNASDSNISIRGFNRRVSNKVLVLVDGRSVYQDFLGDTLWPLLNVAVQDIARIEVIRGPGSALYGANAFNGVVNIITKTGDDLGGARAWFQGGDHNTLQGGISAGARKGKLSYRTSVGYDRADKWTTDISPSRADYASQFTLPNRSREVQRADVAANYDAGGFQMQAGGGFNNFDALELVPIGSLRTFGNFGQSGFARLELDSGSTKIKSFWNSLRLHTGPEYWPNGITSLNSTVRSDVIDTTAQTGFDFKAAGQHHLSIGFGYRFKTVAWDYLALRADGTHRYNEHHFNAFLQEEWQPSKKVSVVLSYRIDRAPLLAQNNVTAGGIVQSPRGTLLYEFKPDQVLRLTVGSAFRASTYLESYIDLLAPVPNQPAVSVRFQGSQSLQPEQMLQGELGYRGRFGEFQPDLVVYAERVTNLITDEALRAPTSPGSGQGGGIDPVTGQFVIGSGGFVNDSNIYLGAGVEAGGKWSPADGVDLGLNYSFERIADCSSGCSFNESKPTNPGLAVLNNTAQHKVNFSALWRTKANFDLSTDVHFVSSVTWNEDSFNTTTVGGVLFTPYTLPAYTLINGRLGYRFIKDRLEAGFAVYNLLGDDHREHPFGNKIGRRLLGTISGSF